MTDDKLKWEDEVERFLSEVRIFLADRFGNGYDWEKMPKELWQQTNEIVYKLLSKKFRKDCDGDSLVQFVLVDRSRGRFMFPFMIEEYSHKMETLEEVDRAIREVSANISTATNRLDELVRTREIISREKSRKENQK